MTDHIKNACDALERSRQQGNMTFKAGFTEPRMIERYGSPQPSGETAIILQQQAILENNDARLDGIIADLGGATVCARLYVAGLIAAWDKVNSIG